MMIDKRLIEEYCKSRGCQGNDSESYINYVTIVDAINWAESQKDEWQPIDTVPIGMQVLLCGIDGPTSCFRGMVDEDNNIFINGAFWDSVENASIEYWNKIPGTYEVS